VISSTIAAYNFKFAPNFIRCKINTYLLTGRPHPFFALGYVAWLSYSQGRRQKNFQEGGNGKKDRKIAKMTEK